jgi:hypothetical protein
VAVRTILDKRAGIAPATLRRDAWWLPPLITVVVLLSFVGYGTWVAFGNAHYFSDPYVSPFYSPCIAANCEHTTFRIIGTWWGFSPALLILPFVLGFRVTCYYYRKAYYRSFWLSPPACAVREPHKRYTGETRFPLILENLHRVFLYAATLQLVFVWWDVVASFHFPDGWGVRVGTIVLLVNATMLSLYTVSCHSARHIVGGYTDEFSKHPARYRVWRGLTKLNERHMLLAWISLFVVAFADLYIRLLAMGHIHDFKII